MHGYENVRRTTVELTGRGNYVQLSIQSIKLRNTLTALRSNDLLCRARVERADHSTRCRARDHMPAFYNRRLSLVARDGGHFDDDSNGARLPVF